MKVRLEPIGETIDCGAQETVLDAAFRQGLSLAHGCREGQCSACKCYLLQGDVELMPYSTFALSDTERAGGYALMCRAMPVGDAVVELLHYDPEDYRLENAIREATGVVEAVAQLTEDIVGVTLTVPEDFAWLPGQYVDVHVPGEDGARRSFSVASLPDSRRIELMIKRYPGGRLSGMLGSEVVAGSRLTFTGPYGAFHLRRSDAPILMVAGGSGMAPVLGVLRQLAAESCVRPIRFFYGARSAADLFALDEIAALGERLPDFTFTPVTEGFVHDAIDEELESPDVYMCGPPPMLEAVEALLTGRGVDPSRIFQDRFTLSADAATAVPQSSPAVDERAFGWFAPAGRRATLYEDVTVDTQPSVHRHLRRGWPVSFADGRGTWDDGSTALRSRDWFAFRDPGEQWERPFYQAGSALEQQMEGAVRSAAAQGLFGDFSAQWVSFLGRHCRSRRSSSTGCGSPWRPRRATACRTPWPPASACRRPTSSARPRRSSSMRWTSSRSSAPSCRSSPRGRRSCVTRLGSRRGATSSAWPPPRLGRGARRGQPVLRADGGHAHPPRARHPRRRRPRRHHHPGARPGRDPGVGVVTGLDGEAEPLRARRSTSTARTTA